VVGVRVAVLRVMGRTARRGHALHPGSERDVGPYHPGLVAQLCAEVRRSDLQFLGFDFPPSHWIQARMALAYVRDRGLPVLPPATPRAPGSAAR